MTFGVELFSSKKVIFESISGAQAKEQDYFESLLSYKPVAVLYTMENFASSEQDADAAKKLDEEAWVFGDIVNTADQVNIATCEALAAFCVKFRSAGVPVPGTPMEIIELSLEGMYIRMSSATAEMARFRSFLQTSEARVS